MVPPFGFDPDPCTFMPCSLFLRRENLDTYLLWLATLMDMGYEGDFCVEPVLALNFPEEIKHTREAVEELKLRLR